MEIYERITYLRKDALHLSQTAFGELLGVSRDVISNIEQNRLKQPEKQEPIYKLICKTFDINDQWLRTGEGEMYRTLTAHEEFMSRFANVRFACDSTDPDVRSRADLRERLASAFLNLSDAGCDAIIELIDDMGYVKKEEDE